MNLVEWSRTPVWKDTAGCVGNLPKSITGTFFDPPISEEGRQFLADLLLKLSDEQLRGMFEAARVHPAPSQSSRSFVRLPHGRRMDRGVQDETRADRQPPLLDD